MYQKENNYGMVADLHCHTIASVHAYSTIAENVAAAKERGLKAIAITEHAIGCPDSPPLSYFNCLWLLPDRIDNVRVLHGVEANIMDFEGHLDMPEEVLAKLDIVIASFHDVCIEGGTVEQVSNAYLRLADNPYANIIGHPGTPEYAFDYEKVIPVLAEAGKIIEINNHSFRCREKSISNCRKIAEICKKYRCRICVDSDAHTMYSVGVFDYAFEMLREIDFPEELIINNDEGRLQEYLESIHVMY